MFDGEQRLIAFSCVYKKLSRFFLGQLKSIRQTCGNHKKLAKWICSGFGMLIKKQEK